MMAICPICGKRTVIHWPEHWVYRRGPTYYCSDNCMYVDATRDMQMMHKAIHKRKEAWKMARLKKDGTPAKKPGRKPKYNFVDIKELKTEKKPEKKVRTIMDPDVEEKMPEGTLADAVNGMQNAAEQFFGKCEDMGLKLKEMKEDFAEKGVELVYDPSIAEEYRREQAMKNADAEDDTPPWEEAAANPEIWRTTAVSNDRMGEFYYDRKYRTVDWRHPAGEEISLVPEDWKKLADIIPHICIRWGRTNKKGREA